MRRVSIAACAAALLLSSCASLGDPFLMAFGLSGEYQSRALTEAGIAEYKEHLQKEGDIYASEAVMRYFEAALRYDPSNAEAKRYLALVEDFRAARFSAAVKEADGLLKKSKRGEDDEYALYLAVRRASDIYPRDDDAVRLVRDTKAGRAAFIASCLERSDAARESVKPEWSDPAKERAYIEAFRLVLKVRDVDPSNAAGSSAYYRLKADISTLVKRRLASLDELYAKNAYEDARAQIGLLKDLDAKIGQTFRDELVKAEYRLYFSWARYHESRKEWAKADSRVISALALQRTGEAVSLQQRVIAAREAEDQGPSFDAGVKNLDAYIARNDLARAQRLLSSLSKSVKTTAQRQALESRRKTMREALDTLFATGVKAYREERFKDAIAVFESVMAVDAAYPDAAGYLAKSREKQALVDQY